MVGRKYNFSKIKRKKGNKYLNKKVIHDGIEFASEKEGDRYLFLKEREFNGTITDLKPHVTFVLLPHVEEEYIKHLKTKDKVCKRIVQKSITYICDFQYFKNGELIVEDIKPNKFLITETFKLKCKMMFFFHHIKIRIVYSPTEDI